MTLYRVAYFTKSGESKGFDYFAGSVIARAAVMQAEKRGDKGEVNSYDLMPNQRSKNKVRFGGIHHPPGVNDLTSLRE